MKYKSFIGIRTQVEGFHRFVDAIDRFGKDIEFLQSRHRHIFYVDLQYEIDVDREKEFILLKRDVTQYLFDTFGQPCEFDTLSCESIARLLLQHFKCDIVSVSEDNENYSTIKKI